MKKAKRVLAMAFAVVMVLALSACGGDGMKYEAPFKAEVNTRDDFTLDYVYMSSDSANLKITNASGETVYSGPESDVSIQRLVKNEYRPIKVEKPEVAKDAIMYQPESTTFQVANWADTYGTLPAGEYRLVKTFNNGENDFYCAFEFEIKEVNPTEPVAEEDVTVEDGAETTVTLPDADSVYDPNRDEAPVAPAPAVEEPKADEEVSAETVDGEEAVEDTENVAPEGAENTEEAAENGA